MPFDGIFGHDLDEAFEACNGRKMPDVLTGLAERLSCTKATARNCIKLLRRGGWMPGMLTESQARPCTTRVLTHPPYPPKGMPACMAHIRNTREPRARTAHTRRQAACIHVHARLHKAGSPLTCSCHPRPPDIPPHPAPLPTPM